MKNVLFFFLFANLVVAQKVEKTILIKDIDTQLTIEEVSVLVLKTKQILLSNQQGEVSFMITGGSALKLSHPSYEELVVKAAVLKQNNAVVYLKSSLNKLDELIVTRQHPQKILKSLVSNSIKSLNIPARLKVYSREFFKHNGVYSYYTDGLLNFQLAANQKKVNATILVEQNRSFGTIDQEVSPDLLGYNLNNIMENYYSFKYLAPVLDPKFKDKYYFLIRSYSENDAYYVLTATPLDNSKEVLDEYRVIYDNQKKLIIEVSSKIFQGNLANNLIQRKGTKNVYKSDFKTTYRVEDTNYFLVSSKEEIGFEKQYKKGIKNIEVKNYLVTTNFSNQNYTYREPQVFKDKTLINKGNSVLTNYWDFSGLAATDEEQRIIELIKSN
ncbi:hypothetical protein SAMN05444143_103127 [Flavobacterium succinicans]|uniref:CarboxypepD_reg-like domain-containing protein n=1 Tax=Flavobacterium succinicans TaxID=29536 RepID=A0A1I4UE35_9FLAO|nr:hypothetical protein [Flavobacterium succinicans]SFM87226.1 hypothetical protein SAMN05444143_103127 [Flavobacterium succinicans]